MLSENSYLKIISKKEFSKLPRKDVEIAYGKFEKRQVSEEEKIRLTRDLLRKIFSGFTSGKLLSLKNRDAEWILRKHLSTRERLPHYPEVYSRIFKDFRNEKEISVIDLGAGVNGFSYGFLKNAVIHPSENKPLQGKQTTKINYTAIEAVGQLADLMNNFFEKQKIKAIAIHDSLLETEKIKNIIEKQKRPRIIFILKTIDSLEMEERNYSKKFLKIIVPLANLVVVSFPTESMLRRRNFFANRKWILDFFNENFRVSEDFSIGGERYLFVKKQKHL